MTYLHPLAFLLGLEGVALLRATAGDDGLDRDFVEARIAEVRRLLDEAAPTLGDGVQRDAIGTVEGYRSWSATYDRPGNPMVELEEPVVRGFLADLPPGRALDAACGTGRHAAWLAGRGHRVTGVDSSPEMLELARAKVPEADLRLGDLRTLPVPDGGFDLVVCGLAVNHVAELPVVLSEFARVLRPGGHLVLSDGHLLSLYLGGVAHAVGPDGRVGTLPAYRRTAADHLTAALAAGFRVRGCAEPGWPPSEHAGGPQARRWCPEAADVAYTGTPAVIVWHFTREV
ncbi:class I SAM-dependent methyltransferase [Micromonospora auratinigra]|uniref:Methyltransferase domain-containing protein n=1 Tax=Micromonospora auratinigra TaxID=261654 RepID=A0A1A8Z6P3_9ACTN|nr:class I SAM-dependent methyltransferase [Micromonospora auratinigra]SBT39457.1 Methyltransferase domain-containing protein [Micromonospora auratinigra]